MRRNRGSGTGGYGLSAVPIVDFSEHLLPCEGPREGLMAPPRKQSLGEVLRSQGFDDTTYDRSTGRYRPRCSQCEVVVINGMACHETGCPNQQRNTRQDDD